MWRRPDNWLNSGDAYYTAICPDGRFSMLFCRCREGVRVELTLRLAPGIHGYGPNGVKIGLILPRLFKFSETVKKMTFSYTVFQW